MMSSRWPRPIGRHGVDHLDARLQRLFDRLALDDARRLDLDAAVLECDEGALAVDRVAERVDDSPEQPVADRDREDAAGGPDDLALVELVDGAEHDGSDRLLVEVEGEADGAVLEFEQLVDRAVRARPVTRAIPSPTSAMRPTSSARTSEDVLRHVAVQRRFDVFGADRELWHVLSCGPFVRVGLLFVGLVVLSDWS